MPGDILVFALGGNAIAAKSGGTFDAQYAAVRAATREIARLAGDGYRIVVTHGNGPQVGDALLRSEHSAPLAPPLPLHACVAETQGMLGAMIEMALAGWIKTERGISSKVATLVTRVLVSAADPAFEAPTKPVGPVLPYNGAKPGAPPRYPFPVRQVAPGRYRRVVPSPDPVSVLEAGAVRRLLAAGYIVIACGGGGIPVVVKKGRTGSGSSGRRSSKSSSGGLSFVDAVVDKDLASERLASAIGASRLVCLTDVAGAYVDFRSSRRRLLRKASVAEMKDLLAAGHFEEGTMEPKVRAAVRFAENTGRSAVIAHLGRVRQAAGLAAGTVVYYK